MASFLNIALPVNIWLVSASNMPFLQGILSFLFDAALFFFTIYLIYTVYKTYHNKRTLQSFLEIMPDGVIIFDRDFRYSFVNSKALAILQKKREELIGKSIYDVYGKEINQPILTQMKEAMEKQKGFTRTYYSSIIKTHLESHFYPSPQGISLFVKDIGNERRAQENLKKSEANFMRLIDANIVGVAVENTSGRVLYANDVFLSMIGYNRTDIKQNKLNWREITPKQYKKIDDQQEKLLFEHGSIKPYEKEYVRKDGSIVPVLKGGAVLSRKNKTSIIFTVDITDRKEIEKRKDDFISIASHELKTPITSIKGFTQLLISRSKQEKDKKMRGYLERMLTQINRLTYLVNDILDVRKIQEGKLTLNKEFFDINELITDVVTEARNVSPLYTIETRPGPKAVLFADYYRIYQAILNLITNAVKYSTDTAPIRISVVTSDHHAEIMIEDRGIGISTKNQKRIFDKFFRIKGQKFNYPGLGLGLYITADVVSRHKGKIWVDSPTQKEKNGDGTVREFGSTFHLRLPLAIHNGKRV